MRQDTINTVIKQHEGLVFHMLHEHQCAHLDDARSAAYGALWRAAETFDETRGNEFSSYACTCIRNAIFDVLRVIKKRNEMEVPLDDYLGLCTYDTHDFEHEEETDYTFLHDAVDEALSKLSGKRLIAAQLWIESDMSVTAIAKEVPCSQSYASQALAEFKALLRKELINAGYPENFSNH